MAGDNQIREVALEQLLLVNDGLSPLLLPALIVVKIICIGTSIGKSVTAALSSVLSSGGGCCIQGYGFSIPLSPVG